MTASGNPSHRERLLHTVNRPQQPVDTLHASTSPQKEARTGEFVS
jgi:hypothetical protein